MKVVIFGASGATGLQLVEQAIEHGHLVTAFVRNPEGFPLRHSNLRLQMGDVLYENEVEQAVSDQDAVLCSFGASPGSPSDICSRGTEHIVSAMRKHQVRRIIAVTGMGTGGVTHQMSFWTKIMLRTLSVLFYREFKDKHKQDHRIRQSGLDWTIVQPPTLTMAPPTGVYRLNSDRLPLLGKVSRADVAGCMIAQLESREFMNKAIVIY